jgi:hypothetical protein
MLCKKQQGQPAPWYALSSAARKLMEQRARSVTITNDFTRPYRCIVKKRGHYTMDDWRKFATVFSVFILMDDGQVSRDCRACCSMQLRSSSSSSSSKHAHAAAAGFMHACLLPLRPTA